MSDSKVYMVPDGNNSLDPNLMLAMTQSGGFGNGANWMWPMFLFFLFPWLFAGNGLEVLVDMVEEQVQAS